MCTALQQNKDTAFLDLSQMSVLVVDSDHYAQEMLNQIMRGFGLREHLAAESGEAAKNILGRHKFELAIVEGILPDMLGADLVKWMRQHSDATVRYLPIIVLTGLTTKRNVEMSRDCGANTIVCKPISSSVLFDHIVWSAASDRSFVETTSYVGPDRRFRSLGPPEGVGRRSTDLSPEIGNASEPNLLQSEIDSLIKPVKMSLD